MTDLKSGFTNILLLSIIGIILYTVITKRMFSEYLNFQNVVNVYSTRNSDCLSSVTRVMQNRSLGSAKCRVEEFIASLNHNLEEAESLPNTSMMSTCHHVFYNAVPKCGSRTVLQVFIVLSKMYNYTYFKGGGDGITSNPYRYGQEKVDWYLNKTQHDDINFKRKHTFFVDFTRKLASPRVMINLIRHPVDHVISTYNWLAFGDELVNKSKGERNLTLDDCLAVLGPVDPCIKWRMMNLPFFYGNAINPTATVLQDAKWQVENTFLLVGVMEEFRGFFEVLEVLLPHLFCGAPGIYDTIESATKQSYKTKITSNITEKTRQLLSWHLRHNIDFYYFVRQRFHLLHRKVEP